MAGSDAGLGGVYNSVNLNLYHYANNNPVKYTDPTGMWVDNEDGTYTAEEGDTLHGLYGDDWQEKSGFTRDPTTLQVGETVGAKNTSKQNDDMTFENNQMNNDASHVRDLQSKANYVSIFGAGVALVAGGNFEIGYVWDSLGNKGIALSGDLGCGVSAGLNIKGLRAVGNFILTNVFSDIQSYTSIDGTIYDFEGSYATAKVHAIGGLTTDLNNTDDTKFSIDLSVGGGAFWGETRVFGF